MNKYISQKIVKVAGIFALTSLSFFTEAQPFNWNQAGPIYAAGRMRSMIVDKTDPTGNTLYVGSTTSGVFKSTNGGTNWLGLQSTIADRVVSYMAQSVDNTIYVATGEGFLRPSEKLKAQAGSGLYKITGTSLTLVASAAITGSIITKVACSPTDPMKIAIAGSKGILVSMDGGVNFSSPTGIPTSTNIITGQDLKFNASGILYCSLGNENGDLPASNAMVNSKVFKSNDASLLSFSDITPPAMGAVLTTDYGRIELAVAPSNNNVIYASCAKKFISTNSASSITKGLFVSYNAGTTWALITVGSAQLDALSNGGTIASGDKAHVVTVDPFNSNKIFIGSYKVYSWTLSNGDYTNPVGNWYQLASNAIQNAQFYMRENVHDIKFVTSGGAISKYYFVTDAGIYRSSDNLISFQPFYQGIVTGQFNTVSIERYPVGNIPTATSSSVTPYTGFIGGTNNAGLIYYSGNYPNVTQESSFIGGEIYASELSKILPSVAYSSSADGKLWLNSDIKTGAFSEKEVLKNTFANGLISAQSTIPFANNGFSLTGTPFKMWENYGQLSSTAPSSITTKVTPDSLVFYNDTLRFSASITGSVSTLITQTSFSWSAPRPNKYALIDSIVIRTGTVTIPVGTPNSPPFTGNDLKQIQFVINPTYTVPLASPTLTTPIVVPITSYSAYQGSALTPSIATNNNTITLNQATLVDEVKVNFAVAPFANKTATSSAQNNSTYYRVFCTVFYKYTIGDSLKIIDNSISTKSATYKFLSPKILSWRNTSNITSTITAVITDSIKKRNIVKIPAGFSSRLAFAGALDRIYVSTQHLSLNDPLSFICVSGSGALTTNSVGAKTNTQITVSGKPTILEWSKKGLELYYATNQNRLYRVSYLHTLIDSTSRNYNGKLHTGIFNLNAPAIIAPSNINPKSPYRTTLLGTFTTQITSINVSEDDSMMVLTFNDPLGTPVMYSTNDIRKSDISNIVFTPKTGDLITNSGSGGAKVNTALIEKSAPYTKVFVGTDAGLYYTNDISAGSPLWSKSINVGLPDAQIFDIKQQTMQPWECYNSGQIYLATNGRGVWSTNNFFSPQVISVKENAFDKKFENNLTIYPNPTNGEVFVSFNSIDGETATVNIMDVTGKVVLSQYLGKLYSGQLSVPVDASALREGIYIVNVTGTSGVKRVTKLIVTN